MDYYKQKIYIPAVDKNDNEIGKVERWEAHKKGTLHRAYEVAIFFEGKILCQHRKHPLYDGYLTLTATSHPYYINNSLQNMLDGVYGCLNRECNITKEDLLYIPKYVGKIYYQSRDNDFIEHEICHYYVSEINKLPTINYEYAYGYSLLTVEQLKSKSFPLARALAPWVEVALKENLF